MVCACEEPFSIMDYLQHPFNCCVVGVTGCGKTHWTVSALNRIYPRPEEVFWCYTQAQPAYGNIDAHFIRGMPEDMETILQRPTRKVVVLDDLMEELGNSKVIQNLFTRGTHHTDTSVIVLLQNMFHQGKSMRTISLNSHYMVLFKNPRDKSQIIHIAKQMTPQDTKYLVDAYNKATEKQYGYLFCDFKQSTPEDLRFRTDIFTDAPTVYLPIKGSAAFDSSSVGDRPSRCQHDFERTHF